ncbi:MAG: hypothetical protein FJZ09_06360 [Candidatus Omnitrophica bacterium]|nr:hypothetical protein [Candidatus Omnitrophota bacterium]
MIRRLVSFGLFFLLAIPAFAYVHPELGFSADIPADWDLVPNPEDADLRLAPKDSSGLIQVASSESEGLMDPIIFANAWESQQLGEDKALKTKILGEKSNISGYPAFRGIYQSDEITMEMICIATSGRIYLLSATFPESEFSQYQPAFEDFARTFRIVKTGEVLPAKVAEAASAQEPQPRKKEAPLSEDARLGNIFKQEDAGYTIRFPSGWIVKKQSENTYIFSGKEGSLGYYSTINIQKLRSKKNGGIYGNVDEVVEGFKKDFLSGDANVKFFDGRGFKYADKNVQLEGKQFKAEYTMQGTKFRQWLVVISDYSQDYFYAFSYTSPADQYDFFSWIAELMLETWRI